MKCAVCNYEHEVGLDENGNWKDFLVGDEKFHRIRQEFFIYDNKLSSYFDDNQISIRLFGCPKCQTIRFEKHY